jgi:methionyl aminopeptidase
MNQLVKTPAEIEKIKTSAKILAGIMRRLKQEARPGVKLIDLDALTRQLLRQAEAKPAFLGYRSEGARFAFPYALCTSVNEVVVHGRPSDYILKSGDLLKLDLGVDWQGGISDAAVTLPIGKISKEAELLIKITFRALREAIRYANPGNTVGDIGYAIEKTITAGGGKIIEELTGHGVGRDIHEPPIIYNFGRPGSGLVLKEGMVLAIEPMASLTTSQVIQLKDDSFATADGSLSAHFEHTILITRKGAQILTK